jgi:hypothetical protein
MFIIFRFFTKASSIVFIALIPVYSAELALPVLRGFFVSINTVGITFGYYTALYIGLAFYYSKSTAV